MPTCYTHQPQMVLFWKVIGPQGLGREPNKLIVFVNETKESQLHSRYLQNVSEFFSSISCCMLLQWNLFSLCPETLIALNGDLNDLVIVFAPFVRFISFPFPHLNSPETHWEYKHPAMTSSLALVKLSREWSYLSSGLIPNIKSPFI